MELVIILIIIALIVTARHQAATAMTENDMEARRQAALETMVAREMKEGR